MNAFFRRAAVLLSAPLAFGIGALAMASCSQTPPPVPVRTFERAQRMDVVCLKVFDIDPNNSNAIISIPPEPAPQNACAGVATNVDGSGYLYHLYALVTQTTRGEVAVVDLTSNAVVDVDRSIPGINFLTVGNIPSDVASLPNGEMVFVGAGEANKYAIYGMAGRDLLGDSREVNPTPAKVPTLATWPSCALPARPGAMAVVTHDQAGVDGGAPTQTTELVVVLPGDRTEPGKLITIDPQPFLRGAGVDTGAGDAIQPGSLAPCPITSTTVLSTGVGIASQVGAEWSDGVPYGSADLSAVAIEKPFPDADGGVDGGVYVETHLPPASAACATPAVADAGAIALPNELPRGSSLARDGSYVYVADDVLPLVHVFDLSVPAAPKELPPYVASSVLDPGRRVSIRDIAVSPPTRDYKKYIYAIDKKDGSVIVFDATDPTAAKRGPMMRPHAEVNPFDAPDRLSFSAPVVSVAFGKNDFALAKNNAGATYAAASGLLCNPNPNVGLDQGPFSDLGAYYRANVSGQDVALGPSRLRGIFAFVTLSNGLVVTIDVDDWDAPCRRPDPMTAAFQVSDLAVPQVSTGAADFDPYHAPLALPSGVGASPVTQEAYFAVSAPNRPRSYYFLRRDDQSGLRIPNISGLPQLFNENAPLPTSGRGSNENPIMLPPATTLADPTYLQDGFDRTKWNANPGNASALSTPGSGDIDSPQTGVRFSFEDPVVHVDQNWAITYEGALPGFDGIVAPIASSDGYETVNLPAPDGLFCHRGIEDARVGRERAQAVREAMRFSQIPAPARLEHQMGDYIHLVDPILPADDPYWQEPNDCWDDTLPTASLRQDACVRTFGADDNATGTSSAARDFPIAEGYQDRLVLGRYGYPDGDVNRIKDREVVAAHPGNAPFLKRMKCCFHNQAHFSVRAGAEWVVVGSQAGYLHHITADASGACVQSCESRSVLLNSRAPAVPRPTSAVGFVPPTRNSALAMRNPMFSFVMWNGEGSPEESVPKRDMVWKFGTSGQFTPYVVNLAALTSSVNPQSMRFIEPLGQIAIVDGASQGLMFIDLRSIALGRSPLF